jgi:hypothetical protein
MSQDRLTQIKHYRECIASCFACAQTCETCSDDMIGTTIMVIRKLMAQCIVAPRVRGYLRAGRPMDESRFRDDRSTVRPLRRHL